MKITKMEKGITLVALIITIVVLLILAVVAITGVQQDGIFSHANNAATKYNAAIKDENGTIGNLGNWLIKFDNGSTTHNWGDWKVVTQANCKTKTNGSQERECSECGEKETQVIFWEDAHEIDVADDYFVCTGKGTHYWSPACYNCGERVFRLEEAACSYRGSLPQEAGAFFYCEWDKPSD